MGLLTKEDNEKIKRAIPKGSSKIIDATVAKLYIAYPDPDNYTDTGLSGAIVLVDDLVGKTFFMKLVDIHGQRGVIWDQEVPVNFQYFKDRTFFHSFEVEEFNCGLLFEDINEANHFFKRVTSKEKYGSKDTVKNKSAISAKNKAILDEQAKPDTAGPRGFEAHDSKMRRVKNILYYNDVPPGEWREVYEKIENEEGISEWMIADNRDFIKEYVNEHGPRSLVGLEPPIPRKYQYTHEDPNKSKQPPAVSKESTPTPPSTAAAKKKKAPPPPPDATAQSSNNTTAHNAPPAHKFSVPPAPSFLGEGLKQQQPQQPQQQRQNLQYGNPVHAAPPPLPPKTPIYNNVQNQYTNAHPYLPPRTPIPTSGYTPQFGGGNVPTPPPPPSHPAQMNRTASNSRIPSSSSSFNTPSPPSTAPQSFSHPQPPLRNQFQSQTPPPPPSRTNNAPPPPPSRKFGGPPPPPSRKVGQAPPPPPSRTPHQVSAPPLPPQKPIHQVSAPPLPPQQPIHQVAAPPLPPPSMPSQFNPAQARYNQALPLPTGGPPPPPPQLPTIASTPQSSAPAAPPGNLNALFSSIQGSGVHQLKKVDKSQVKHF